MVPAMQCNGQGPTGGNFPDDFTSSKVDPLRSNPRDTRQMIPGFEFVASDFSTGTPPHMRGVHTHTVPAVHSASVSAARRCTRF